MTPLNVGIIGAGGIAAKSHLPELQAIDGVQVTIVGGRKLSRLETFCRKFGVPTSTQNYDEIISDDAVDAVVIALPHPLHVEWGIKALQAGKHVYMQKPLSTSLEDADRFVQATEDSKLTVLALPYVSRPPVLAARQLAADGQLGTVSAAHARHSHGGPEVYYAGIQQILEEQPTNELWFFDADQADVGAVFDMGVYAIANLVAVLGSVCAVTARCATVAKPTRLEDTAAMLLDFECGALGTVETGWCDAARTGEFSIHATAGKLVCSGGAELMWHRPGSQVDEDAPPTVEAVDLSGFSAENSHEHWVRCIREGRFEEHSTARNARHVTEIMLRALESSGQRKTVEIRSRVD